MSKYQKGAFRARKTLQKFGCIVMGHMGALFRTSVSSFCICLVRIEQMNKKVDFSVRGPWSGETEYKEKKGSL